MKVIIVGAGVVGITTAYYLEAEGHEVTVVERQDRAGMETSFANAGQLCRYTARPWAGPSVPAMIFREMGRASAPYLVHLRFDPQMWRWLVSFLAQCRTSKYQKTRSKLLRIAIHSSNLMDDLIARENIEFDRYEHFRKHTLIRGFIDTAFGRPHGPDLTGSSRRVFRIYHFGRDTCPAE